MTQLLEDYLKADLPEHGGNYFQRQRSAFQQLIQLSKEKTGPIKLELESQRDSAKAIAQREFDEAKELCDSSYQSKLAQVEKDRREALDQIELHDGSHREKMETQYRRQVDQLNSEAEAKLHEAKKTRDYDVLLSDTVCDETLKKIELQRKQTESQNPQNIKKLELLQEELKETLKLYRQSAVTSEPSEPQTHETHTQASEAFDQHYQHMQYYLQKLHLLKIPGFFSQARPFLLFAFLTGLPVGVVWFLQSQNIVEMPAFKIVGPVTFGVSAFLVFLLGWLLRSKSKKDIQKINHAFNQDLQSALSVNDQWLDLTIKFLDSKIVQTKQTQQEDTEKTKLVYKEIKTKVESQLHTVGQKLQEDFQTQTKVLDEQKSQGLKKTEATYSQNKESLDQELATGLEEINQQLQEKLGDIQDGYQTGFDRLKHRWQQGLDCINQCLETTASFSPDTLACWQDPRWHQWSGLDKPENVFRFGNLTAQVDDLDDDVKSMAAFSQEDGQVHFPAILSFSDPCSLLLETQREGRQQGIDILRGVMSRLFVSLPAGRVHFTILDPIGLGENFAGFMHAADYQDALVGGRIWTEATQIQQQLVDITEHMENVIQKYLRNEFETIEQYNEQAGELAEPYRFLVIADFPRNFNEESIKRLRSIIDSGKRCGVYTLIMYDSRQKLPEGIDVGDLASSGLHLKCDESTYRWQDDIYRRFDLTLDQPPTEELLTSIVQKVGKASLEASRVEVPFEIIAPSKDEYWSKDCSKSLDIPVGRCGATRYQQIKLGHGVAQHALIAGKTGSGKSTLLHVMITNLALWYSPDQVELYLIDFKKGVEFKTYVTNKLPHARTVAIESDREFGLSILQKLEAEMTRRGDLFRDAGVQDLAGYRQATGEIMPRAILMVDEFQVFFSEDDKLAQEAALQIEQLVRQGRAFGIHVLLGSQTLGGMSGLSRSTIGQMAIRIALQCSETDSQFILDDENVAARLLSRPGEAIYNDAGGQVVANSPFQTAWLSDDQRDIYLSGVHQLADEKSIQTDSMIVFEGNVPANLADNQMLEECMANGVANSAAAHAWLGEPVAIKDPTSIIFRRQSGTHLLMTGQREDASLGLLTSSMLSLAAQSKSSEAKFMILDGSPADAPLAGQLAQVGEKLPHVCEAVQWRDVEAAIQSVHQEMQKRLDEDLFSEQAIYIFVYGLQRYRMLRRNEDDFGFSMDEESKPRPDKQFAEILKDGSTVGIHVLVWADTLATIERTLDRQVIRNFDNRVLFQMSAADSSQLVDTPLANQLGHHRALFYSEESGVLEKFRPYAMPHQDWLDKFSAKLEN